MSIFVFAFNVNTIKAQSGGTIYINPDGSISSPVTANITISNNETYTFTGDNYFPIVVNRSNIVVNGKGYTLQAPEGKGFCLTGVSNVTIENTAVTSSSWGIFLYSSSDNDLSHNNFTGDSRYGIELDYFSDNNIVSNNNVVANGEVGIELCSCSGNVLSGDNVANVKIGICLDSSSDNVLSSNNVTENSWYGILLSYSSGNVLSGSSVNANGDGVLLSSSSSNMIYHNNFINNAEQVTSDGSPNTWNIVYPSGGNYWSDYQARYSNATEIDGSGIWNKPYVISVNNTDCYPLMRPWMGPLTQTGENVTITDASGISLTFSNVTSKGMTTVSETRSGPNLPSGFELASETPTYIDIRSTANYTGTIQLIVAYDNAGLSLDEEGSLCLLRWNETTQQWNDITTRVDTISDVIYAETTSLSTFALMLPSVTVSSTELSTQKLTEGSDLYVTVTVTNHSNYTETFNVTIYAAQQNRGISTPICTFTNVTLQAGASTLLTAGLSLGQGSYDLSVKVSPTQDWITLSSGIIPIGAVFVAPIALFRLWSGHRPVLV